MPSEPRPIHIAVVGHTNAGKTSLLRTLTRRRHFGEVSDRPGTTRHVEAIDLNIEGQVAIQFFDTPGLEDSTALLHELQAQPTALTRPERVRSFLDTPAAQTDFEQEAKVLRTLLEVDAALYVIDCREPVLPKYHSEIEILTHCGRPVLPVLNFVHGHPPQVARWQAILSDCGLHAQVMFDAVAPFVGAEQRLYDDLATLLRERREQLRDVTEALAFERLQRRDAALSVVALALVRCAALRHVHPEAELAAPDSRMLATRRMQDEVQAIARRACDDLLAVHAFDRDDADPAVLPLLAGRWESDLFHPESLKAAGREFGTGAVVGGAVGLAADLALGGLSLGVGTSIGASVGGLASQGFGRLGRALTNRLRGLRDLSVEDAVLRLLAWHLLNLQRVLEDRGHAALTRVHVSEAEPGAIGEALDPVIAALAPARSQPGWAQPEADSLPQRARRSRCVEDVVRTLRALSPLAALPEH